MLRGEDFAQPRALVRGDVLSNGWEVHESYVAMNSNPALVFTNGITRVVAPRLPLQLKSERSGVLPGQLRIGQILQTSCVVLEAPKPIGPSRWYGNQNEIELTLTGGLSGHRVGVPDDIELSLFEEEYPPKSSTLIGRTALEQVQRLSEEATVNLPKIGHLGFESYAWAGLGPDSTRGQSREFR